MPSSDALMWLFDWALPVALGTAAAAGFLAGLLSNHSRGAEPADHSTPQRTPQADYIKDVNTRQPQRLYSTGPRPPGSAPRLAWCRLPGNVLELEGCTEYYIHVAPGAAAHFTLRDGTHRLIRHSADLDMLMREGEHLASIDATATAVMRRFVPRLRDR